MNVIIALFPFGYLAITILIAAGFFSQDWKGFGIAIIGGPLFGIVQIKLLEFLNDFFISTAGGLGVSVQEQSTINNGLIILTVFSFVFGVIRLCIKKPKSKKDSVKDGADQI